VADTTTAPRGPGSYGPPLSYTVDEVDADGRTVGRRFHADGSAPSSIALDPSGTRLLITLPDGSLLVQEGKDGPRAIASGVQSAVWLP